MRLIRSGEVSSSGEVRVRVELHAPRYCCTGKMMLTTGPKNNVVHMNEYWRNNRSDRPPRKESLCMRDTERRPVLTLGISPR